MSPARMFLGIACLLFPGLPLATKAASARAQDVRRVRNTGCVFVLVSDSASNRPVSHANTSAGRLKRGGIADSLGQCTICSLPEGAVVFTTMALRYSPRSDTVRVSRDRTDTLRVRLRRLTVNAGETLLVEPRHTAMPVRR